MGGVHYTHISRYERNQSAPSIEALKKLAKIFGVSTDYLLFDDIDKMTLGDIHDPELLHQFRELDRLDNEVRGKARFLLEAILTQQQVQQQDALILKISSNAWQEHTPGNQRQPEFEHNEVV